MKFIVGLSSLALFSISSIAPSLAANQSLSSPVDQSLPSTTKIIQVAQRRQRVNMYQKRQQERAAAAAARREQERRYFESLTPEQQRAYLAQRRARQEQKAKQILLILGVLGTMGGNSGALPSSNSSPVALPPVLPSLNLPPSNVRENTSDKPDLVPSAIRVCKKYESIKPKNAACIFLTVRGMYTLLDSQLDATGVDFSNRSRIQAFMEKGLDELFEDKSFVNHLVVLSREHDLTKDEQGDILFNLIDAYRVFKIGE